MGYVLDIVLGSLNAAGGAAIAADPDTYNSSTSVGIVNILVGGGLAGLGVGMRSSANNYNKTCADLLSNSRLEPGFGLEPIAKEATGMRLIYRW